MANQQTQSVCQIAHDLTNNDRIAAYGHPKINFEDIAAMWSVVLRPILKPGERVTATQVGLCNVASKICRHVARPKRDNLIDMAGYANTIDKLDEPDDQPTWHSEIEQDIRPAFPAQTVECIDDHATQLVNKWSNTLEPVPELPSDIDQSPESIKRAHDAFYEQFAAKPPEPVIEIKDVSRKATPSDKVKINRFLKVLLIIKTNNVAACGLEKASSSHVD